jgi:hypothetical protein
VQHGGDTDVGAEMLGIGRDRQHGLGGGLEQQVVDDCLVVVGDIGDGRRHCEDDVEVADGQQLRLTLGEPLLCGCALAFWAVPVAAAVIGDDGVRAVLAARDMAAERRGAAALDRTHHLHLVEADVPRFGCAPRRPVVAEDVRDLQYWTGHSCQPLRRQLGFPARPRLFARQRQQIERAGDAGDHAGGDARVARRGV